jgi:hypothetical protein
MEFHETCEFYSEMERAARRPPRGGSIRRPGLAGDEPGDGGGSLRHEADGQERHQQYEEEYFFLEVRHRHPLFGPLL